MTPVPIDRYDSTGPVGGGFHARPSTRRLIAVDCVVYHRHLGAQAGMESRPYTTGGCAVVVGNR